MAPDRADDGRSLRMQGHVNGRLFGCVLDGLGAIEVPGISIYMQDLVLYAECIDEIVFRLNEDAAAYMTDVSAAFEPHRSSNWKPDHRKRIRVQIDIESFYLFSKTFLDKLAHLVERCLGRPRGLSLASHDKLSKNIERYLAALRHPSLESTLTAMIPIVKQRISDFRDYEFAHAQSLRARGLQWSAVDTASVRVSFGGGHSIGEKKVVTKDSLGESIPELHQLLEQYVMLWVSYLAKAAKASPPATSGSARSK